MCGIAGCIIRDSSLSNQLITIAEQMGNAISHRGPNDSGVWVDEQIGLALSHRRLSILDLSSQGHQPMVSFSGRYVIILNGEIYNFKIIRAELEKYGYKFRGHSDTEVALSAIEHWGFDSALSKFDGMFAFALWDCQEKILRLARDRLGEKPFYYGKVGKDFIFASELKALRNYPYFNVGIDRQALELYLLYAYVPAPYSIYKGILKLFPGTVLTLKNFDSGIMPEPVSYWSAIKSAEEGLQNRFKGSMADAAKELNFLLKDAVNMRMEADVPLGVFLSGGIDSSLISALMQRQSFRPVKTFTIGFHEKSYNEAEKAREIANYLGTDHTEMYVNPQDSLAVIPQLPDIYDEPFADSSQIPTYLVSKLTRQHVTVSLSGDGGDEVFGGYNRYFWGKEIWGKINRLPLSLRKIGAQLVNTLPPEIWSKLFNTLTAVLPQHTHHLNFGDKIYKLAEVIDAADSEELYFKLISFWRNYQKVAKKGNDLSATVFNGRLYSKISNFSEWMMCLDLRTYLPDDIMVKVDRASMSVGLESRAVFLDHRIVEFAQSIPAEMKINNHKGKLLLRMVLNEYLPERFFKTPKMGFGLPLDSWLRGPLKSWAENLLDEKTLEREGFFNPEPIRRKWIEHLSGKRNWQYHIWIILMFQAWKERWL